MGNSVDPQNKEGFSCAEIANHQASDTLQNWIHNFGIYDNRPGGQTMGTTETHHGGLGEATGIHRKQGKGGKSTSSRIARGLRCDTERKFLGGRAEVGLLGRTKRFTREGLRL